jgi:hypothetical protein
MTLTGWAIIIKTFACHCTTACLGCAFFSLDRLKYRAELQKNTIFVYSKSLSLKAEIQKPMKKITLYIVALLISLAAVAQKPDNFILVKGGKYPFGEQNIMIELSDFYISPTEVSYKQMAMYALDNALDPQTFHSKSWGEPDGERVAINVNWFDAIRYAN